MSDGIADCREQELKEAIEKIEKKCANCKYFDTASYRGPCSECKCTNIKFEPSQEAIEAKIAEMREEERKRIQADNAMINKFMWRSPEQKPLSVDILFLLHSDGGIDWTCNRNIDVSKYAGWMYFNDVTKALKIVPEMLNTLKRVAKWGKDYPSSKIYSHSAIIGIAKEIDAICEEAEQIIAKAEGK